MCSKKHFPPRNSPCIVPAIMAEVTSASAHQEAHHDAPKKKKKRGCRGCFKGCFILFLILFVIGGIAAFFLYRVPQRLGLLPNAAKREFVQTPNRAAGQTLLEEATTRGFNPQGAHLYVLPYKDDSGNAVIALLDSREGFAFARSGDTDPVGQAFVQIAGGPKAEELKIKHVTIVYVSARGEDLMTLSASRADVVQFANGQMSDAEFMAKLNGELNVPAMVGEQIDSFNRMMQ